jgi:DNA-binding transcriptional MocR family regulator
MGWPDTVSAERMSALLGSWAIGPGPLYSRLGAALRRSIERGELTPHMRLPPERQLARALVVSRTTVIRAYEQLKTEGWLESRRGSGTWVLQKVNAGFHADSDAVSPETESTLPGLPDGLHGAIDLSTTASPALASVWEVIKSIKAEEFDELGRRYGYEPAGTEALREAVATSFTNRGLPTHTEEVLVTNGALQGIGLVASLYLRPGDRVVVEDPTCPMVLSALRTTRARLLPVPIDAYGVDPEHVEEAFARASPNLAYVTPAFHNPTGAVMDEPRRQRLALTARRFQIPLVEDLTVEDVVLEGKRLSPIAAFAPDAPILSVGSLSKLFWAGLRMGWVRGPAPIIAQLARLKAIQDLGSPLFAQTHAARLLALTEKARIERRTQLVPRLDCLTNMLSERLPDWEWRRPRGGLSVWVRMPAGDTRIFAQLVQRRGVVVVPGTVFSVKERHEEYLRIPFVLEARTLATGIEHLARAWHAWKPEAAAIRTTNCIVV